MAPRDSKPSLDFVDAPNLVDPKWYSHAVSVNGPSRLVFTSGQIGQLKDGTWPDTFAGQVKQAVINLDEVLKAAGASPRDIIKLNFYVVDWSGNLALTLVEPILKLLTADFGLTYRPITTLAPVPSLAYPEAKFEIEAVAAIGGLSKPWNNGSTSINHPVAPDEVDVVVVGGGFSGLMAAYEAQSKGLRTILLEAKHRVGGRSRTQKLKSGPGVVELGATWINKTTQPKVYALAQKFGLETVPQYTDGDMIFQDQDGNILRAPDGVLANIQDPDTADEVQNLLSSVEKGAEARNIRKWDDFPLQEDISFSEWVVQKGLKSPFIDALSMHLTSAVVGCEPGEVGVHYLLDYIKSAGGYISVISEGEYGAQSLKIKQGTSAIAAGLAAAMKPGSVVVNSPVDSITQYDSGTVVTTSTGNRIKARKVILAIPTNTYDYIQFSPPLPPAKKALVSRTMPGIYAKVIVTYRKPWWKDLGLVGKFTSLRGPICFSWDISEASLQQFSLAFFVAGQRATKWGELSALAREEAIINHLAELVGPENRHLALDVLEINAIEWTKEDFIFGAPTSSMGPKQLSQYGSALREPFINIHFGGGETAYEWKGYLEGAIGAGDRVAAEVIDLLKSPGKAKL